LGRTDSVVVFKPYDGGSKHGNFLDASFKAIRARPEWSSRLEKVHPRRAALPTSERMTAKELDSCMSSDALLMNVFCHPGVRKAIGAARLLGFTQLPDPEFGFNAKVRKQSGPDDTEVDMRLGDVLVESKLTENDFTSKPKTEVEKYVSLRTKFEVPALPQDSEEYVGYQLIRNVLAADQHSTRFVMICDSRRPDLVQQWWSVMRAIKAVELRQRCSFLTWQQISAVLPREVRKFLALKYGIEP
jgi:hypothetical protein